MSLRISPESTIQNRRRVEARRRVLQGLVASTALALVPRSHAALPPTPATGLVAERVRINGRRGDFELYRAAPQRSGRYPVILVLHEQEGLNAYIEDVCRRLARLGVLAIAPDLLSRQPNLAKLADDFWMDDCDAAIEWARGSGNADPARTVVTGFGWGGRGVWLYCAHNRQLRAGISWYGLLGGTPNAYQPKRPEDVVTTLYCPVLAFFGGFDQQISASDVGRLRKQLRDATANQGKDSAAARSKVLVLPEARHGFHADHRPSYRAKEAQLAWDGMISWIQANAGP